MDADAGKDCRRRPSRRSLCARHKKAASAGALAAQAVRPDKLEALIELFTKLYKCLPSIEFAA